MTEREKIVARIRALRAKTVENGCTEDEAISAAAKVVEMLARYNLTVEEAELRASPFETHEDRALDAVGERLWKPAAAIAALTGAKTWTSGPGVHPVVNTFFGFDHEVEVARYLLDICAGAMRREQTKIMTGIRFLSPARQRRRVLPFLDGMADRLHARITALIPPAPIGTGIVVLRGQLIDAALAEKGLTFHKARPRPSRDFEPAYLNGLRAGDRVALNPGLGDARNRVGALLQ
jgi:hypothetical protein